MRTLMYLCFRESLLTLQKNVHILRPQTEFCSHQKNLMKHLYLYLKKKNPSSIGIYSSLDFSRGKGW